MVSIKEKYLLVDVGDTLVSITQPFEEYTLKAIENIYPFFNYTGNLDEFKIQVLEIRNLLRKEAHTTLIEFDFKEFIRRICISIENETPKEDKLIVLELAYVSAELEITTLFDDAEPFLKKASLAGKELIIATNNFSRIHVIELLKKFELDQYFNHLIISGEINVRKPNTLFLKNWIHTDSIIIGDKLTMDIALGNSHGISSCWVNRNNTENNTSFVPSVTVNSLNEIDFS